MFLDINSNGLTGHSLAQKYGSTLVLGTCSILPPSEYRVAVSDETPMKIFSLSLLFPDKGTAQVYC